jgi:drug/metabolite transporter (DMT)-like permease
MALLVWITLSIIWGLTWLAVRIGLDDLPPFNFAGIRFVVAALVLFAVMLMRRTALPRSWSDWVIITQTGLLTFGLAYSLQFWGQQYVSSGLTAVMFSTVPLFTMLLAHARIPSEPLTRAKLVGVTLGIAGVTLVFSDQLTAENPLAVWGCIGFLIGSLSMAYAQVAVKNNGTHIDPLVLAGCQMAIGAVALLAIGIIAEGSPFRMSWTLTAVTSLSYLSIVCSALAFFLLYWLLRHMDVTKVTSMALVHPLVAVLAGWIVLNESLSWRVVAGGGGILAGLALILPHRSPSA